MLPNVLLAGLPKCGTTAIYHWFRQCDEVFVPEVKEPHFLAGLSVSRVETFSAYERLFASANEPVRVDCSTSSLLCAERVLDTVRASAVPIRAAVVVYRNPVERAISHWNYARKIGQDDRTLAEVENDGWATPGDPWDRGSAYVDYGLLDGGLTQLRAEVPTVRVLPYSVMRDDPLRFLTALAVACGAPVPRSDSTLLEERNVSLRPRGTVGRVVLRVAQAVGATEVAWPRPVREIGRKLFIPGSADLVEASSSETRLALHERFVEDQRAVRELERGEPDLFPIPFTDREWID